MARPIRNHDSEFVYEPFSGSGTTIIACEQLGRKCRAIEISPAYVAVALQRWADATGKTPRLVP
jgi:DNA modification methylase